MRQSLLAVSRLMFERNQAMARARWCKSCGYDGYAYDVQIARTYQRMLLRAVR